jgi:hypothetical protein
LPFLEPRTLSGAFLHIDADGILHQEVAIAFALKEHRDPVFAIVQQLRREWCSGPC